MFAPPPADPVHTKQIRDLVGVLRVVYARWQAWQEYVDRAPHLRAAGTELAEAVRQSNAGATDTAHATLERALRRVHDAVFGTPDWRFVELAVERAAKGRLGPRKRNTH